MNDVDRLDRWLPARLADLVGSDTADYLDDVLGTVATTRQRPAWSFPGRWLPMAEFVGRPGVALSIAWRPIATVLIVAALLAAAGAVYVGSRPRGPEPFGPAANGRIAYTRPDGTIWSVAPDGSYARIILSGEGRDSRLSFSPDGRQIAFAREDRQDFSRIMVANADGSDLHEITTEPLWLLTTLAWAPDGRSIALAASIGGRSSIAVAQADGSGMAVLDLGMTADSPAWRPPDGRELLVRGRPVTGTDLFIVNAHGGDPRSLGLERSGAFYSAFDLLGPTWSPDGTRVAYHTPEVFPANARTIAGPGFGYRVHVVDADGSNDRILGPSATDVEEAWPKWSPDGRSLLLERFRGDERWLALAPADGSDPGQDLGPRSATGAGIVAAWSPDGTTVLAHDLGSGELLLIDIATGDGHGRPMTAVSGDYDWQRVAP